MSRVLPILFNTDMVRAILDGRKTVTRRVVKPQPDWFDCGIHGDHNIPMKSVETSSDDWEIKPPYRTGDILYVRETWSRLDCCSCEGDYQGRCAGTPDKNEGCYVYKESHEIYGDAKWHPSIHMPKEAARIWLKVTDVRVERLQEITPEQSVKEGVDDPYFYISDDEYWEKTGRCNLSCDIAAFSVLWDSTIKKTDLDRYGWDSNPWVWVIEFERCEKPEE